MSKTIQITKATGEREEFDPKKLEDSLLKAGANAKTAKNIVFQIEEEITDGDNTKDIYKKAFRLLGEEEKPVAARYSLRRAVMELGPTGFPFEQFVSEIFKAKGFKTRTDVIAKGKCAEHEIDITAWDDQKLIFVEAKFHNELGMKSDLKVALYVKARWDDLMDQEFDFGSTSQELRGSSKKRKLDEGWLVTNTKFSEAAINYAKCQNMKLVGWNYPNVGNLQDLIEETHLHPITCLNTTTPSDEKLLMEAGIVLCKQALDNPDIVRNCGISKEKAEKMIEEIKLIQKS